MSCEKEIDLKYKHDFDRLVVEAILVKGETTHQIRVSREINYFEVPEFKAAEDVLITIKDEAGNTGTFYYLDSGYYRLDNYDINFSTNYTLSLKDGNKTVEASCKTSSEIVLDSLILNTYSVNGGNYPGITPVFTDPLGEKNYYIGSTTLSGFPYSNYYNSNQLFTDELIDGQTNTNSVLFYNFYESGDTLEFRLRSVDYYRHQFLKTINESYDSGGFFSAAPSNPISNFKDKALGYFSVELESRKTFVVP